METSSENYDQVDDSNNPTNMLDESSHGSDEFGLITRDCEDNASEEDDISEEIDNDDDDDEIYEPMLEDDDDEIYESMLEEVDDDDDHNNNCDHQSHIDTWNCDYYKNLPLFEGDYRCFPLSFCNKTHLDVGNKIIMPANALEPIIENQIPMPLQFEIRNLSKGKVSHCGVFEFSGQEDDAVFMPDWMMENMEIEVWNYMYMKNKELEKATYIKLQPHGSDFMEISNPKDVLEENLQKFSCLTKGDTIMISHGNKMFYINIVETEPADAVSLIDTDCEVDFSTPLDYKEPANPTPIKSSLKKKQEEEAAEKLKFKPFTGLSRKLGEKPYSDLGSLHNKHLSATVTDQSVLLKEQDKEIAQELKFKPFTGLARKLGENPYSDLGSLHNKHLSATVTDQSDLLKEQDKEIAQKSKFKPFTGLARKLDEGTYSDLPTLPNSYSA
ncbi:hypothetical protein HRI_001570000 [Hibiscus trionum]|uniref:Uncharacterized protein n=1 Tax=Hibiscus trionum TaxID=183268 RepID=A0A9W7LVB6_HIBTR|nr:hypothetical protein HRI_001570000 [Hibiscus trionum]